MLDIIQFVTVSSQMSVLCSWVLLHFIKLRLNDVGVHLKKNLKEERNETNVKQSNERCQSVFLLVFHVKHLEMFVIQL